MLNNVLVELQNCGPSQTEELFEDTDSAESWQGSHEIPGELFKKIFAETLV